jgi:NADH-quinone oxidoreductase subunit E
MSDLKDSVTFTPAAAPLAAKLLDRAQEILARFPEGRERSALLPLLHLVQSEEGFVSPSGVAFCAEVLGINKAQVGAVATFYTMYKRRPTGDFLVSVCTNTMCNVLGGQEVYDTLAEHLGVGHQETTGNVTLEHAECLAACDYGPVMTVNYDFYDNVTPDGAVGVVDQLQAGERPAPTRGARLCTLKEMSLQLAGFSDVREGAVADGPAGAPTLRGVTLAQDHGIAVANFNPDTPIPAVPEKDRKPTQAVPSPAAPGAERPAPGKVAAVEAKVVSVAKKVADTVKSAAATVADKAHHSESPTPTVKAPAKRAPRKAATAGTDEKATAGAGAATRDVVQGDVKDPESRAAESRNPDAATPGPGSAATTAPGRGAAPNGADAQAAEAAGAANYAPAGDGKPVGDAGNEAQERNLQQAKESDK